MDNFSRKFIKLCLAEDPSEAKSYVLCQDLGFSNRKTSKNEELYIGKAIKRFKQIVKQDNLQHDQHLVKKVHTPCTVHYWPKLIGHVAIDSYAGVKLPNIIGQT